MKRWIKKTNESIIEYHGIRMSATTMLNDGWIVCPWEEYPIAFLDIVNGTPVQLEITPPEPSEADLRFAQIKAGFWAVVDTACAEVGKTRADLPDRFNAEDMITLATINGMTATSLTGYAQKFMVISLDILHNYHNWDDLFKEI